MTVQTIFKVAISTIIFLFEVVYAVYLYNEPEMGKSGKVAIIVQGVVLALAFVGMWI